MIALRRPDTAQNIRAPVPSRAGSPAAGRWRPDGLGLPFAIAEYVAERAPEAGLWPADPAARAVARAVTAEICTAASPACAGPCRWTFKADHPGQGMTSETVGPTSTPHRRAVGRLPPGPGFGEPAVRTCSAPASGIADAFYVGWPPGFATYCRRFSRRGRASATRCCPPPPPPHYPPPCWSAGGGAAGERRKTAGRTGKRAPPTPIQRLRRGRSGPGPTPRPPAGLSSGPGRPACRRRAVVARPQNR